MRLGLFMMPVHPPGRTMSDTLREDTAKSLLADQLGFDELWMGEHFSATTEPFPSPLMFLAGLVPQAKNLTFGTAVINLSPAKWRSSTTCAAGASISASGRAGLPRTMSCSRSATAPSAGACSSNASTT